MLPVCFIRHWSVQKERPSRRTSPRRSSSSASTLSHQRRSRATTADSGTLCYTASRPSSGLLTNTQDIFHLKGRVHPVVLHKQAETACRLLFYFSLNYCQGLEFFNVRVTSFIFNGVPHSLTGQGSQDFKHLYMQFGVLILKSCWKNSASTRMDD